MKYLFQIGFMATLFFGATPAMSAAATEISYNDSALFPIIVHEFHNDLAWVGQPKQRGGSYVDKNGKVVWKSPD